MLWKSVFVASLLSVASLAAPIHRRDTSEIEDNEILKFLNVVEQLKSDFYTKVNAKFHDQDFTDAGYTSIQVPKQILSEILADDQSHASFLADGIEGGPLRGCQFKFDSILTDVHTAMSAARVFEQVSVAAYLGAGLLIQEKNFLLATSSILTNSARHQSAMNVLNGGTNTPQPFDFALRPEQVLSVISPFVSGCDMEITPVKPLKLKSELHSGVAIQFDTTSLPTGDPLFCQMLVGGQPRGLPQPIESCSMPVDTIDGPIYFFITDSATPLPANILTQDLESIKAGPAVAFVDGKQAVLSPLVVSHDKFVSSGKAKMAKVQSDVKVIGVSHMQAPIKGNKVRREFIEDQE